MAFCKKIVPAVFRAVLCFVLALSSAFTGFARQVVAAEDPMRVFTVLSDKEIEQVQKANDILGAGTVQKRYISDVMVGSGKTAAEAEKAITDAGYIPFKQNLNEGAGGYEKSKIKVTYLGYKLTDDPSQAITNMNVMEQDGGYKDYNYYEKAKESYAGLADTSNLMQRACKEFLENVKAGKKNALASLECLNIFCVPESSKETEGILLGDYLTSGKLTTDNCEELLLVLNAMLSNILLSQIAIAGVNSTLDLQTIEGTDIVSETGVCGYSELYDAGSWLTDAYNKLETTTVKGDDGKETEQIHILTDICDETQECFDQIYLIDKAMNGGFSEKAVAYLKSVSLKGKIDYQTGRIDTSKAYSAYDFLKEAPRGAIAGFLKALPEVCGQCHFTEVVEICANDASHRIPKTLKTEQNYHIDWIEAITGGIESLGFDPYDLTTQNEHENIVNVFREESRFFASSVVAFFDQYNRAVEETSKITVSSDVPVPTDKLISQIADTGEIDSNEFCPELYLGMYNMLKNYEVKVMKGKLTETITLADYLGRIDAAYRIADKNSSTRVEKEQNRWFYYALCYPIITSLSDEQWFAFRTNTFDGVLTFSLFTDKERFAMQEKYAIIKAELTDDTGAAAYSVWNHTNKELLESEYVAMCDDQTERDFQAKLYQNATSNYMTKEKRHLESLIKCGFIAAGCVAGILIAAAAFKISAGITASAVSAGGIFSIGAGGISVTVSAILGLVCLVAMVSVILVALGFLIAWLVEKYKTPKPVYSAIPTLMMDSVTDINGNVIDFSSYYVVRDQNGDPADINGFNAKKWTAVYYTKNPKAGSPLTCDASGNYFGSAMGSTNRPNGSHPLSKFTRFDLFNLNNNCYKDSVGGIYVWFFTENSLNGTEEKGLHQKYVASVRLGVGKTADAAKSYLARMTGYYVIDYNLAPDSDFFVYLGYSTTSDASKALRDIRVACGSTDKELYYGQLKYVNVLPENKLKCPLETCDDTEKEIKATKFNYSVFTTQIDYTTGGMEFGYPILSNSFEVVNSIDQIDADAEPVTVFGGGAFDFDYWEGEGSGHFDTQRFLTFKYDFGKDLPYNERPGATKYVSGISFFSGTLGWNPSCKINTVEKYARSMGYIPLDQYDLTNGILNDEDDVTYLAYTTTYNPIHAITDIGVFTGEPKSAYLPTAIVSNGVGYAASAVFTQGDIEYYDDNGRQHEIRSSHAYFTCVDDEGYHTGWGKNVSLMARGLYLSGYRDGVRGLTEKDIVFSFSKSYIPTVNGANNNVYFIDAANYVNINDRRANCALGTGWKTVHPLDRYYYDSYDAGGNLCSSFNMGLGSDHVFCLYVRNETIPDRVRGNYVATAQLVSSLDAYSAFNNARITAMANGADIVNLASPMQMVSSEYPDLLRESPVYMQKLDELIGYADTCFYVVVSYTDNYDDAICNIRVVEQQQGESLSSTLVLPLTTTLQKDFSRGTLAAKTTMGPDFNLDDNGNPLGDEALIKKQNSRPGYFMYTCKSGTPISRLVVQKAAMVGSVRTTDEWHVKDPDAAESFLPFNDTFDPFCMQAYGSSVCQYISAVRYDFSSTQDKYRYISDISVVRVSMHDKAFHADAAKAGAQDLPFYVEYNLLEGQIGDPGSMESAVIAFKRTGSAKEAVKNIKIASEDLGEYYEYMTLTYRRANSEPLRIDGFGNESIYIYYTKEVGADDVYVGPKILWEDLYFDPDTDWENVDWRMVDISSINSKQFSGATHTPNGSESLRTYRIAVGGDEDDIPGLRHTDYAVRDLGIFVGENNTPDWAGTIVEHDELRLSPSMKSSYSRDSAALQDVVAFDGKHTQIRLVYTNTANQNFDEALRYFFSTGEAPDAAGTASVFVKKNLPLLIALLGVSAAGLGAAAWVAFRRKKKTRV